MIKDIKKEINIDNLKEKDHLSYKEDSVNLNVSAEEITHDESLTENTTVINIKNLEEKIIDLQDQLLRTKAEVENNRKRAIEEISKTHKFAIEHFSGDLLPVIDSLNAAINDNSTDIEKIKEGIQFIIKQLYSVFEKNQIIEINPIGLKFDPHYHQAISTIPTKTEVNIVMEVLQKGYMIVDRILRPALVVVSQQEK